MRPLDPYMAKWWHLYHPEVRGGLAHLVVRVLQLLAREAESNDRQDRTWES